MFSDPFGPVGTRSDTFGCIRMCSDVFDRFRKTSVILRFFDKIWMFWEVFGRKELSTPRVKY